MESIDGSEVNPVTRGFICSKVREFPKRLYGVDRLLYPMRRVGAKGEGRFERIGWDDALERIASRFAQIARAHGAEAILPYSYGGSNGMISEGVMDRRFFRRLGASRLARTLCAAPTGLAASALYGKMACADLSDAAHARCIVVWGANPKQSNIHLVPYLQQAKRAGATIALVDPRLTLPKSLVDLHLPVFPGTDVVLALSIVAHLAARGRLADSFLREHATGAAELLARAREFPPDRAARITRLPAPLIERLAETYAAADPALIRCGWGLERNRNGEAAVAAVLALPAVAGKFGKRGGGYALSSNRAYGFDAERAIGIPPPATRTINMSRLGRVLTEPLSPPINGIYIYDCNPVVTAPDQLRVEKGLSRDDLFTVVHEQVMTDTARYADVLLPATTFLEHTEISLAYGSYSLHRSEPVVAPRGEARPNDVVFAQLMRAMGLGDDTDADDTEALAHRISTAFDGPLAGGASALARAETARIGFDFPGPTPVQFGNVFPPSSDRKAHLYPPEMGPEPYRFQAEPEPTAYPLAMISPATSRTISSTLGEFNFEDAYLEIHPADASARGIADGSGVRVHNELGEVIVTARLSPRIRPGVVCLPKGIWKKSTRNANVGTALVPDTVQERSGGACYNDARVEVAALR